MTQDADVAGAHRRHQTAARRVDTLHNRQIAVQRQQRIDWHQERQHREPVGPHGDRDVIRRRNAHATNHGGNCGDVTAVLGSGDAVDSVEAVRSVAAIDSVYAVDAVRSIGAVDAVDPINAVGSVEARSTGGSGGHSNEVSGDVKNRVEWSNLVEQLDTAGCREANDASICFGAKKRRGVDCAGIRYGSVTRIQLHEPSHHGVGHGEVVRNTCGSRRDGACTICAPHLTVKRFAGAEWRRAVAHGVSAGAGVEQSTRRDVHERRDGSARRGMSNPSDATSATGHCYCGANSGPPRTHH